MSKTAAFWMAFLLMITASCNNFNKNFLTKKTPKEIYKDVLKKKDPLLLSAWDYAGKYALEHPLIITDSYALPPLVPMLIINKAHPITHTPRLGL